MRQYGKWVVAGVLGLVMAAGGLYARQVYFSENGPYAEGMVVEALDNVPVYDNGPVFVAGHGRHYAPDGYYFGQKWQCVEFIKRYLYTAKGLRMPDVWGNAITFFDPDVPQGALNAKRGMVQFRQSGPEKPQAGDLLVFAGAGGYGHVAIVAAVTDQDIEIVQQNAPPARAKLTLFNDNGNWRVDRSTTLGWLRVKLSQSN